MVLIHTIERTLEDGSKVWDVVLSRRNDPENSDAVSMIELPATTQKDANALSLALGAAIGAHTVDAVRFFEAVVP